MKSLQKIQKHLDKTLPISERKAAFKLHIEKVLNPIPAAQFNPKTFEPIDDPDMEPEVYARERKKQSGKFPTFGIEPKVIREGQLIGMYESKQDIYLMFAHKFNDLIDEVESLKKEIKGLKSK